MQPWIHDFAAYDLWVRPLGLLRLAGFLRGHGIQVSLIDCLDPHNPALQGGRLRRFPTDHGAFYQQEIPKPAPLKWFPRRYKRYGIPPALFLEALTRQPTPDVILVGSGMTYWYPGVQETISHCRKVFPEVPVVLGGIYATLLPEHAREFSGADLVVSGGDWDEIHRNLAPLLPLGKIQGPLWPVPAWDLAPGSHSICVKTSEGCPLRCAYCASHILAPQYRPRPPQEVALEILAATRLLGAMDVAFYDDALLWQAHSHLLPVLERLKVEGSLRLRFHCPNGLHARYIDQDVARELRFHGFATLRLGLESVQSAFHLRMGPKLSLSEFDSAVHCLMEAGYAPGEIGVYILAGLPGQSLEEVEKTVGYALSLGLRPHLAEYSPIPGTDLWEEAVRESPLAISEEPLFQNNTLLPCRWKGFPYEGFLELKACLHRALQKRASGQMC